MPKATRKITTSAKPATSTKPVAKPAPKLPKLTAAKPGAPVNTAPLGTAAALQAVSGHSNIVGPDNTPRTAARAPKPTVNATPTADPAIRASARDGRYLDRARYTTDGVTALSAAYVALFAAAAKAAPGGIFNTSGFAPNSSNNPESPKRNFRARAKLLADAGILTRIDADRFTFTAAVSGKAVPVNASSDLLAARTAYANAK